MATEHVVICDTDQQRDNVSAFDQEVPERKLDAQEIEAALHEQRRMDALARLRRLAHGPHELAPVMRDVLLVLGLDE